MSKYTITIKDLIKNDFDFMLNNYPIFNEEYRSTLNKKILDHYYMNEIGQETPALFRFFLRTRLNEIMSYYNNLYLKQETLLKNLEHNVNLTETFEKEAGTESTTSSNGTSYSKNKNLFQDTPQGEISMTEFEAQSYATNLTLNNGTVTDESASSGNVNGTENYIKTIIGNNGGKYNYEILKAIKDNILNIDMMIIEELNDLFIGLL